MLFAINRPSGGRVVLLARGVRKGRMAQRSGVIKAERLSQRLERDARRMAEKVQMGLRGVIKERRRGGKE